MDFCDFSDVKEATEFTVVPEDDYHIVVTDQQWTTASNGTRFFEFRIEILAGEFIGEHVIDKLFFTDKSKSRAKFVLSRLGDIDVHGSVDLSKVNLVGKQAIAKIGIEKATDPKYSDKNNVAYTGYSRPDGFAYIPHEASAKMTVQMTPHAQQPPMTPPPPPHPPSIAYQMSPDGQYALIAGAWVHISQVSTSATPPPPPPPPFQAPPRDDGLPFSFLLTMGGMGLALLSAASGMLC